MFQLGMYKSMKEEKEAVYDNREGNLMSFEDPPNVYDNPKKQDGDSIILIKISR